MSNKSKQIYDKHWLKMAKLITAISKSVRGHIDSVDASDAPDHETLLMALQVFSLICGHSWSKRVGDMDELWDASKGIHKIIQMSMDTAKDGELQQPPPSKKLFN